MTILKRISLILFSATFFLTPAICAEKEQDSAKASEQDLEKYNEFVNHLGNEIIKILVDQGSPLEKRKEKFRAVLKENFDIAAIGKFVLARYWKPLTAEQKQEYLKLFEDAIVENYAAQFDNYANEQLKVTNSRLEDDGGAVVQGQIVRPSGGAPLNVDFKVFNTKKAGLKVFDIIINGVSMSITQRSLYTSTIQNNNGKIEALFSSLKDKDFNKKLNTIGREEKDS
jgi:phospholipid transport system substrate-binding protein